MPKQAILASEEVKRESYMALPLDAGDENTMNVRERNAVTSTGQEAYQQTFAHKHGS
jgi:hypothetical protein